MENSIHSIFIKVYIYININVDSLRNEFSSEHKHSKEEHIILTEYREQREEVSRFNTVCKNWEMTVYTLVVFAQN